MMILTAILMTGMGVGIVTVADETTASAVNATVMTPPAGTADEMTGILAAAEEWLKLVDDGKFTAAWDASADLMKTLTAAADWEKAIVPVKQVFGKVKSRKLNSQQKMTSLPSAPDGEYMILIYETSFENKQNSIETLTLMKEKSGHWKVAGYFIR